ncbi:MAG: ATP-binding cassette domain-containing protein [Syntrophales bacterium]
MIEIINLEKSYSHVHALRGVNLTINPGEILGLLGPNGAGKTTLISVLAGLVKPTHGAGLIEKENVFRQTRDVKKIIGLVPQELSLYASLTGKENLNFFGRMYGVKKKALALKISSLLDFAGLKEKQDDLVRTYSGGMKRRLNLICGLIHSPRYVFLDEPTVGVDPQSREHIFHSIRRLQEAGIGILYTTHYIEEAEKLCDRVAIMDEGRIIAIGPQNVLLADHGCPDLENLFLKLTGKGLRD